MSRLCYVCHPAVMSMLLSHTVRGASGAIFRTAWMVRRTCMMRTPPVMMSNRAWSCWLRGLCGKRLSSGPSRLSSAASSVSCSLGGGCADAPPCAACTELLCFREQWSHLYEGPQTMQASIWQEDLTGHHGVARSVRACFHEMSPSFEGHTAVAG